MPKGIEYSDVIDLVSINETKLRTTLSIYQENEPEGMNVSEKIRLLDLKIANYIYAWESNQIDTLLPGSKYDNLHIIMATYYKPTKWICEQISLMSAKHCLSNVSFELRDLTQYEDSKDDSPAE